MKTLCKCLSYESYKNFYICILHMHLKFVWLYFSYEWETLKNAYNKKIYFEREFHQKIFIFFNEKIEILNNDIGKIREFFY